MRMIFPSAGAELDLPALAEAYAYPRERWLRANFVSSADGAAYVDGRSGGLSSPDDKRVFGLLRVLTDVVLVGAGPRGPRSTSPRSAARAWPRCAKAGRRRRPIALVTRTLGLNLASPLFTEAPPDARTIVITCAASDAGSARRGRQGRRRDRRRRGDRRPRRGRSANSGPGPGPRAVRGRPAPVRRPGRGRPGGRALPVAQPDTGRPGASRIIAGQPSPARPLALAQVLAGDDGFLFFRYLAQENDQ